MDWRGIEKVAEGCKCFFFFRQLRVLLLMIETQRDNFPPTSKLTREDLLERVKAKMSVASQVKWIDVYVDRKRKDRSRHVDLVRMECFGIRYEMASGCCTLRPVLTETIQVHGTLRWSAQLPVAIWLTLVDLSAGSFVYLYFGCWWQAWLWLGNGVEIVESLNQKRSLRDFGLSRLSGLWNLGIKQNQSKLKGLEPEPDMDELNRGRRKVF